MKNKSLKNPVIATALASLCCLLWGSAFPAIKLGYELFDISNHQWSNQILFAGVRFTLAGILVIVFGSIISRKVLLPKKSSAAEIGILSVFQTIVQYTFFYIGLAHTTGSKGAIINSTGVFFAVIISLMVFKSDKPTAQKIIGCIIGLAGNIIINLNKGIDSSFTLLGEGFIIICSFSYALSTVFIKKFSEKENPVTLSGYQFALGGIVMIIISLIAGGRLTEISVKGALLIFYLAIVSSVAYTLWGLLLKHNDVSLIATVGFMTPVFGCILSQLILREFNKEGLIKTAVSLILVVIGIWLVNKKSFIQEKNI